MSELKKHVALLYTYNRVDLLGRSIGCWLEQMYPNKTLCIFNNSPSPIELPLKQLSTLGNLILYEKNIILCNNHISIHTKEPYTNLGEIYNDGLLTFQKYIEQSDIVSLWQDDDIYLKNHLNHCDKFEGKVYKPFYSYYVEKATNKVSIEHNNFEGSWFIDSKFLVTHGFEEPSMHPESKLYKHLNSFDYVEDIYADITYVYEWANNIYHSSGGAGKPDNFAQYREKNKKTDSIVKIWSYSEILNSIPHDLKRKI